MKSRTVDSYEKKIKGMGKSIIGYKSLMNRDSGQAQDHKVCLIFVTTKHSKPREYNTILRVPKNFGNGHRDDLTKSADGQCINQKTTSNTEHFHLRQDYGRASGSH